MQSTYVHMRKWDQTPYYYSVPCATYGTPRSRHTHFVQPLYAVIYLSTVPGRRVEQRVDVLRGSGGLAHPAAVPSQQMHLGLHGRRRLPSPQQTKAASRRTDRYTDREADITSFCKQTEECEVRRVMRSVTCDVGEPIACTIRRD